MRNSKAALAILMAGAMAFSLTGCGSAGTEEAASSENAAVSGSSAEAGATEGTPAGEASEGSDLNIMLETPVQSLDP